MLVYNYHILESLSMNMARVAYYLSHQAQIFLLLFVPKRICHHAKDGFQIYNLSAIAVLQHRILTFQSIFYNLLKGVMASDRD